MANVDTSKPLLGRCKECDFTLFATEEDVRDGQTLKDIKQSGVVYKLPGHYGGQPAYLARCDKRHCVFIMRRIKGTFSKDHKCDSRCLNAKGHECICSCGGANHGRGHVVAHVHTAAEPLPEPVETFIGEIGKWIKGEAKVVAKRPIEARSTILYIFRNMNDTASIKCFVPESEDPGFEVGQIVTFRAKVYRHDEHLEYGKATIVTDLKEL